jgi:serine/threonine protein kinase
VTASEPRPDHWDRVNAIFDGAAPLARDARAAFVLNACAGDEGLRERVERLLVAHDQSEGFLAESIASRIVPQILGGELVSERRIGPYRLLREIGHGGMGAVYLAERSDAEHEKRVAIKLIRHGMDSNRVLARFHIERQILASLDHPNIARLLDGGTTDEGVPYFVMEYVEGEPIDVHARARGLGIVQRLELFLHVTSAVAYAHQQLVIHRDIKPVNILVTSDGVPKLLDFGIAKLLDGIDRAKLTLTGAWPLTPEYASPEQVEGLPVATTSDVYSLGVVLYELLTGRLPYRFRSRRPRDVAKAIRATEPERPSNALSADAPERLGRRLREDLDTIVLTALRKEPQHRYASVQQFADDIRHLVASQPVEAHADTLWYRATKLVRRTSLAVAARLSSSSR